MSCLIHIGYQKTGSTWLQRNVFDNAELGLFQTVAHKKFLNELLIFPRALDFQPSQCLDALAPAVQEARRVGRFPVLSSERLCGSPYTGGHDSKEVADRLAQIFRDARILIVIREQLGMLFSQYRHYIGCGGTKPVKRYLNPPDSAKVASPQYDLSFYEYDQLIGYYMSVFGASNVLALPFELFKTSPEEFLARIAGLCGLDRMGLPDSCHRKVVKRGFSGLSVSLFRRLNFFIGEYSGLDSQPIIKLKGCMKAKQLAFKGLDALFPSFISRLPEKNLRRRIARIVGERRYASSNRVTSNLIGLDLSSYNYTVGGEAAT